MSIEPAAHLQLENVRKTYGSSTAVESVSLNVREGEFVSFLGPSGSGKTTTLQMIAGFVQPDSGVIRLAGKDLTTVAPYKRNIGVVFQSYALFPHMTVAENVAFPLKMRKLPASEVRRKVGLALEQVHLDQCADRKPDALSGGQQQRVALARAFVFEPKLLLMDEPLGALDKKLRESLQIEIMRLTRELGITVIYVTHDQDEALAMSDRIAIYNRGGIEQMGNSRELYEKPESMFVATFMGDSNVFRGPVTGHGLSGAIETAAGILRTPDSPGGVSARASDGCLVVRPEKMHVRSPNLGEDSVYATVTNVVYLGSTQRLLAEVPGHGEIMIKQSADNADSVLRPGSPITVSWNPADAVLVPGSDAVNAPSTERLAV